MKGQKSVLVTRQAGYSQFEIVQEREYFEDLMVDRQTIFLLILTVCPITQ